MIGPLSRLRIYTSPGQYRTIGKELAFRSYGSGHSVEVLEREIASRVGVQYGAAMPLARVGIYFALRTLIKPGQKVILSPYTIADVVNMVVCAGGIPVFADIERHTCNIDLQEVVRLIDDQTGAVLVTHFYGLACDVREIAEVCRGRGVALVEDCAQAYGVRANGKPVGTFGDAGIYSFGMFKNVNAFYGGCIVTNRPDLHDCILDEMRKLPYQPITHYLKKVLAAALTDVVTYPAVFRLVSFRLFRYAFLHDVDFINNRLKIDLDPKLLRELPQEYLCRMLPLQARLVLEQLGRVEQDTKHRIEAAQLYHEGLKDVSELILPPLRTDFSHMYWYFPIQYDQRHQLVGYAMRHGRDITESYHRNCAALPCFSKFYKDCPNAQATANSLIYLPTYPGYSRSEIDKTITVVRRYFGK
ncbi:dTDP-4-amino-4,6-dideoxygalactose transaminase [Gammaproteobacteria bacterium]